MTFPKHSDDKSNRIGLVIVALQDVDLLFSAKLQHTPNGPPVAKAVVFDRKQRACVLVGSIHQQLPNGFIRRVHISRHGIHAEGLDEAGRIENGLLGTTTAVTYHAQVKNPGANSHRQSSRCQKRILLRRSTCQRPPDPA
jgi:hypothetical protein